MHPLVSIYLLCLSFVILTILLCTVKMKRILIQNPEFAFIITKISGKLNFKVLMLLTLPIVHLVSLLIYGVLCLIPDEKFIEIFKKIVQSNELELRRNEIKEKIKSYDDMNLSERDNKVKNDIIVYLRNIEINISDLENENALNKYIELTEKFILSTNEFDTKKEIVKELCFTCHKLNIQIDTLNVVNKLLKTETEKDFLIEVKNMLKCMYMYQS